MPLLLPEFEVSVVWVTESMLLDNAESEIYLVLIDPDSTDSIKIM